MTRDQAFEMERILRASRQFVSDDQWVETMPTARGFYRYYDGVHQDAARSVEDAKAACEQRRSYARKS